MFINSITTAEELLWRCKNLTLTEDGWEEIEDDELDFSTSTSAFNGEEE